MQQLIMVLALAIPSFIEIGGYRVDVEYVPDLVETQDAVGLSDFEKTTIYLQTPGEYSEAYIEQTFWHEVAHFILFVYGHHTANENERLVDSLGHGMYQVCDARQAD